MAAEFIDVLEMEELDIGHSKKVLFTSDHFHTWVHGGYPGTKGPMHKHTADQQFYCVKGQCTFHFPDAPSRALNSRMLVTIPVRPALPARQYRERIHDSPRRARRTRRQSEVQRGG